MGFGLDHGTSTRPFGLCIASHPPPSPLCPGPCRGWRRRGAAGRSGRRTGGALGPGSPPPSPGTPSCGHTPHSPGGRPSHPTPYRWGQGVCLLLGSSRKDCESFQPRTQLDSLGASGFQEVNSPRKLQYGKKSLFNPPDVEKPVSTDKRGEGALSVDQKTSVG